MPVYERDPRTGLVIREIKSFGDKPVIIPIGEGTGPFLKNPVKYQAEIKDETVIVQSLFPGPDGVMMCATIAQRSGCAINNFHGLKDYVVYSPRMLRLSPR